LGYIGLESTRSLGLSESVSSRRKENEDFRKGNELWLANGCGGSCRLEKGKWIVFHHDNIPINTSVW
jgi:hypothetical protein